MSRPLDFFTDLTRDEQIDILDLMDAVREHFPNEIGDLTAMGFNFHTDCYDSCLKHSEYDFLEVEFPPTPDAKKWCAVLDIASDFCEEICDAYGCDKKVMQLSATDANPVKAVYKLIDKLVKCLPQKKAAETISYCNSVKYFLAKRLERCK